jgi:adenylate cyclase
MPAAHSPPTRLHLNIRAAVIGSALFLGLALAGSLAWFNYSRNSQAALDVAAELVRTAGDDVALRTDLLVRPILFLSEHAPLLPGAAVPAQGFEHPLSGLFLDVMADTPQIYSAYLGYGNGDFFQIISLNGDPRIMAGLQAPPGSRFALRRIREQDGRRLESWRFLDGQGRVLGESAPQPARYDPRSRPWFEAAFRTEGPALTAPYVFSSTRDLGLTLSRRVPAQQDTVLGVDLTLEALSRFLAGAKVGRSGLLFLFDADGLLVGHPDPSRLARPGPDGVPQRAGVESLGDPRATALFRLFVQRGRGELPVQPLEADGEEYLVQVRSVPALSGGNFLGLIARTEDFTGPLARTRDHSLFFALALIFVVTPGLSLLAGRFTRALSRLAEEADRIRNLQLDSTLRLRSPIDEVDHLGVAVADMRSALSSFSRYLPRTLVKQFIDTGVNPALGGVRRELTLLFSDVENFTPLAENLAPEDLMQAMSEYFQAVGQAILDSGGTIDKFIGDAVMAFWNAPLEAQNHVEQACLAALRVSRASEELNRKRETAGLPLLRTRVGLHTGAAVVGNVGAADRMDYTALGASVNLASRLEGLNKFYGTRILTSQAVRDRARKDFLFRSVDVVVPKGAAAPLAVFELVGSMPASPYPEVAVPRAILGFCSRWERAITLYRTVQWDKALAEFNALRGMSPQDRLADMYCTRVQRLMENKPGRDWKAVRRFMEK